MSLTTALSHQRNQSRQPIPSEMKAIMQQATDELRKSGIVDQSLNVGGKAPDFSLPNMWGTEVKLSNQLRKGPVVLSFYRGGWCPYCNLELRALQAALPDIYALGGNLIAISPQRPEASLTAAEKNELTFEVLSDVGNEVARAYGLVFQVPEALRRVYRSFGIDLAAENGDERFELPMPATYVLDTSGRVRLAFIDPDYTQRLDPATVVASLRELLREFLDVLAQ